MTPGDLFLVRHARAGERLAWEGDDRLRPIDGRGRRQARWLAEELGRLPIQRILTSPFLRCTQTVEPLADELGIELELRDDLGEGGLWAPDAELLRDGPVVACSHGDVIVRLAGPCKKGAVWVVRASAGGLVAVDQMLPPRR